MTGNEDAVLRSQGLWNREYGGELGDNANRGLWRGGFYELLCKKDLLLGPRRPCGDNWRKEEVEARNGRQQYNILCLMDERG